MIHFDGQNFVFFVVVAVVAVALTFLSHSHLLSMPRREESGEHSGGIPIVNRVYDNM